MPAPLPPGQSVTRRFPVVGESQPTADALDLDRWRLHIVGLVAKPLELGWAEFLAIGSEERTVDLHCVTGWTQIAMTFTGVPLSRLLARAGGAEHLARFVRFEAYSARRHDTSLPLALALADTWLVHRFDGVPLAVEHGYPLRCLTPSRYLYKSCKWVHRIELLAEDQLGHWEQTSRYHNNGDPGSGDERFTTGSIRPDQLRAFRAATDFAKWRGRVLIGLDLAGWHRAGADLRDIVLKGCDLREAALAGANLRRANLSLSDLQGADLSDVDFREADLEGVDFRSADLRGADLRGAALTAARFADSDGSNGAALAGCRLGDTSGLLEDQERYVAGVG